MRVETEYQKRLKVKKKHQSAFRRFLRGQGTPIEIREYIGLNFGEMKVLLESRMQLEMSWGNYGSFWVVDHIVPFWLFDPSNEPEMKLLWHSDNLLPLIWKDNNHKQGDLRFSLLLLTKKKGFSYIVEQLIERVEKEIKVQDKYMSKM